MMTSLCVILLFVSANAGPKKHELFPFANPGKITQNVGAITITENGQAVQRYIVSQQPSLVAAYGDSVAIKHNGGASIAKVAANDYSANS